MKIFFIFLIITTLFPSVLFSQNDTISLSFREAETLFVKNNLSLLTAQYNISISQAELQQAKTFENPIVSFEQNVYNTFSDRYFDFGASGQEAFSIEQNIPLFGQRKNNIVLEKSKVENSKLQLEQLSRQLLYELRSELIRSHFLERSISVYETEIQQVERIMRIFSYQWQQGNISLVEKLRLESLNLLLCKEKAELVDELIEVQQNLALSLGIESGNIIQLKTNTDEWNQILTTSAAYADISPEKILDVKIAESNILISQNNIQLQKSLRAPEFSTGIYYDRKGNFMNNYWGLGISLNIPVFNRNQGNLKKAEIEYRQNQIRYEQTKLIVKKEITILTQKLLQKRNMYNRLNKSMNTEFSNLLDNVNHNFEKRNISLLEFIDYYQAYKEVCLESYHLEKEILLLHEELMYRINNQYQN